MRIHWVCGACWGPCHEQITIGGVLPKHCANCGDTIEAHDAHPVRNREFDEIQARHPKSKHTV
jgi:hypothetical protein